jgi:excisionase family DNA binding protein
VPITVKQAAIHAGVSTSLIYAWCEDGSLSHIRVGRKGKRGHIRIEVADLDALLISLKVSSQQHLASAPTSLDSLALPFSELDPKRLARAWKKD